MKNYLKLFVIAIVLNSCASSYNSIAPSRIQYHTNLTNKNIDFSYKYGVLGERGNKKYAKKESLNRINVIAVKVTNNSDKPFVFGKDFMVHSNGVPVRILEPKIIHQNLKQGVPIYVLYLLLTPIQLHMGDSSVPIGLFIGPAIAGGNMAAAGSANVSFLKELAENNLNGRTINAGETVYGIIGVYDTGFSPLSLE